MATFWTVCELLGGITLFILGLRSINENFSRLIGRRTKRLLERCSRKKLGAVLVGAGLSAATQSSAVVNVMLVSLASAGALPLISACALIVGTNMGTTVTAHLVSLSFSSGLNITAIASLLGFIGLVLTFFKDEKISAAGNAICGFCLVFVGTAIMSASVKRFYESQWFIKLFSIKSPPICLLNGFFITAVCQSSSAVTGMLVILSNSGLMEMESVIYYIIGSNIGSCIAVVLIGGSPVKDGRITAMFNLVFNVVSALIVCVFMAFFGDKIASLFLSTSSTMGGACANFHTFFNVAIGFLLLPCVPLLVKLTAKLCAFLFSEKTDDRANGRRKVAPAKKSRHISRLSKDI